ncbi:FMN-dependent NADH-azoreductase [Liberibacter crescens]|uniref:FMN-dependent NADH-azoreductase n=1 Tax=Liberibacter crescens TaxID=1273132 RepID=UPI0007630AF0|nr:NAD(P)H-dependent oxidoreductase [Liberibacter crescens]AMC12849.1 hypothetical protein RL73_04005 [Liberibacter crescens]
MTTILHIKSSSNIHEAFTRKIGHIALTRLKEQNPKAKIIEHDLVKNPVPHVSPEFVSALSSGNPEILKLSNHLIDELFASDIIIIEAPMYNFTIPSVLKAWIDHIIRANKTFFYNSSGMPEGLLKNKGKKAILVFGSGGIYSNGPLKAMDHQQSYLHLILDFIGITDITDLLIEGVGLGADKVAEALEKAKKQANSLTLHAA